MNGREKGKRSRSDFSDGKVGNERKTIIPPLSSVTPAQDRVILGARWGEDGEKGVFFPGLDIGPLLQSVQITKTSSLLASSTAFAVAPTIQIQINT